MAKKTTSNHTKRLLLTLAILFGILGVFIFYLAWPLLTGKTLILATLPVDPFDPLRGQYMTIRYEIGEIPSVSGVQEGDHVYVQLREDADHIWRYEMASSTKPTRDFIRGTIQYTKGNHMNLRFGIEQYFFEKGAELPTRNVTVEVKVDGSGQARIVRLLHNNKPVEMKYRDVTLTS